MKRILIAILLFAVLFTNAQTGIIEKDSLDVKIVGLPDSTAIATPTGKKLSREISVSGGKIISDDGKLELIFPPGALDKTTEISIQPIDASIPNGNKGYHFEPSGIQFQKPVQIIFRYTDEEAEVCPPELKFMALQHHNGKWEYMGYEDWDSSTKTLQGSIKHFSAMVDGNLAELNTTKIKLKPGETYPLFLTIVQPPMAPAAPGEDELMPLPKYVNKNDKNVIWKVNDNTGGTVKHGTIAADKGTKISALYTAPKVLTVDPITIKLQVTQYMMETITERWGKKGKIQREVRKKTGEASFTCKVKLYDEYKVTVSMGWKEEEWQWTDKSTFVLQISDEVSISNIQNETLKVVFKKTKCKYVYVNEATCEGIINVKEIKEATVKQAESGFAKVDIRFSPTVICHPSIQLLPCGINKASPTIPGPRVPGPAVPQMLSFEAKNEKQTWSLLQGDGGTGVKKAQSKDITVTIEPIRNKL